MSRLPIANLDSLEKEPIGDGAVFKANIARLTPMLGMKDLGCTLVELEPGQKAWPFHLHYGIEELFVVIEGQGSIRYGDQTHAIRTGDVISTPTGENTAHQIVNSSDQMLRYLAVSTQKYPETCYYPDSGKYGSFSIKDKQPETVFIAHESHAVAYLDGENS